MKLLKIALLYLKSRPLNSALHISMMAVGVALITSLLLFSSQIEKRINQDSAGIDLVVGAKGSPIQLILSSIYQIDIPTGNIWLSDAKKVMKHYDVKSATPISLGDNFRGFRIVGTDESYFDLYQAKIASGEIFDEEMEAVLGYKVAKKLNLKVGDSFIGGHGLIPGGHQHKGEPYKVVGILDKNNSVVDRLVLTSLESVWDIHAHHDEDEHEEADHKESHHEEETKEITALLVKYKHITAILDFPRTINRSSRMQAASPAIEINRLLDLFGVGISTIKFIGAFLIFASLLSIFISLLSSVKEKKYDIAVMRVVGAAKKKIFLLVIYEGALIGVIGGILGILLGHLSIAIIALISNKAQEMGLSGFNFSINEFYLLIITIALAKLASVVPAIKAYKSDVVKSLNK